MRLLTLASLAEECRDIPFATLTAELNLPAEELELFVVEGECCLEILFHLMPSHLFTSFKILRLNSVTSCYMNVRNAFLLPQAYINLECIIIT